MRESLLREGVDQSGEQAPHQDRQLQANQGDNRDEGIFDGMSDHHDPLPEPLGPGRSDVILPEHLQHHGTHHAHGGCRSSRPQNHAGDEEHREIPSGSSVNETNFIGGAQPHQTAG